MSILITGMLLFFGAHLIPINQTIKQGLIKRLSENIYQMLFAIVSMAGFVIIIWGKASADVVHIWTPPTWGLTIAPPLMLISFYCLVSMSAPTNLKRFTRHPMLWGIVFWAVAHLLTNGDLSSIILFGGFFLYSIFDMWSANRRGAIKSDTKYPLSKDLIVLAITGITYVVILFLHPYLFGVSVIAAG
jgi:uncharacterized membrane protein